MKASEFKKLIREEVVKELFDTKENYKKACFGKPFFVSLSYETNITIWTYL
jgi:hypothetical protein